MAGEWHGHDMLCVNRPSVVSGQIVEWLDKWSDRRMDEWMSTYVIQSRYAKSAFDIATAKHHLSPVPLPCLLQPDNSCLASHAVTLLMNSKRIAAAALS
jgi:hypothetical protein